LAAREVLRRPQARLHGDVAHLAVPAHCRRIGSPALARPTARVRSDAVEIAVPLTCSTTSPGCRPAAAAGRPW